MTPKHGFVAGESVVTEDEWWGGIPPDERAQLEAILDEAHARTLRGERGIPWAEAKATFYARRAERLRNR
ncbi:MAG TPA: hypothetical protein VGM88_02865 [Kofleriaceae bacterium]|jgi:hypothetical protein